MAKKTDAAVDVAAGLQQLAGFCDELLDGWPDAPPARRVERRGMLLDGLARLLDQPPEGRGPLAKGLAEMLTG